MAEAKSAVSELIYISCTDSIRKFLREVDCEKLIQICNNADCIDLDALMRLVERQNGGMHPLNGKNNSTLPKYQLYKIDELLTDSKIIVRQKIDIPEEPLSEIQKIRKQAAERRYQRSIQNILPSSNRLPVDQFQDFSSSIALGANILLGIIFMFLAGFWGMKYAGYDDITTRASCGICLSVLCLSVEVLLFIIRDARSMKQRKKGKNIELEKADKTPINAFEFNTALKHRDNKEQSSNIDEQCTSLEQSTLNANETASHLKNNNNVLTEKTTSKSTNESLVPPDSILQEGEQKKPNDSEIRFRHRK